MKILDTDIFTHLFEKHPRVVARWEAETEEVATTIITQIQALQGRFAMVLTAANGRELQRAQHLLDRTMALLAGIPRVLGADAGVAAEFERLRQNKRLKDRIKQSDLLIAAIALAHRATLVTRNLRHFRQVPGLHVENWLD